MHPGLNSDFIPNSLCDLREVKSPLWVLVSKLESRDNISSSMLLKVGNGCVTTLNLHDSQNLLTNTVLCWIRNVRVRTSSGWLKCMDSETKSILVQVSPLLSPHLFVIPTRPPLHPLWIHRFLPSIFSKYSPRLCLLICHICTNNSQISILSQIFPLSNKLLYPTLGLSTISYPQYSQDRFRIVPLVAHCLCCPSWPCQSPFSQWMALLRRQNSGVLSGLSCYRYTYWCWLWTSLASIHIFDGVFVLYMCVLSLSTKIESSWRAVTLLRSCQALTPAHCQIPSRHSSKCLLIT